MKAGLAAFLSGVTQWQLTLIVSAVAMALGTFVAASPHRAARIWASQRLANWAPERRALFVRWYRAFGILLCLAGVLVAVEGIVFSNYHQRNFHLRSTQREHGCVLAPSGIRRKIAWNTPERWLPKSKDMFSMCGTPVYTN